jgi:hypothetical protein
MKRQIHASSPPLSPSPSEVEPVSKRARLLVPSPTPPPEIDQDDMNDEEFILEAVTLAEDSPSDDDDDDIIEVEQQDTDHICQKHNQTVILVSDSDSDDESDDQGIDVTDDMLPSLPPPPIMMTEPISPTWSEEIEIVQEDEDDFLPVMEDINVDDTNESEFLEIVADDISQELIDLTDDDDDALTFVPRSSPSPERKTSIDVQQCPVCLETLSYLQRTGVHLIITRCCHVMCTLCSRQLMAISPRCPLCRENLSTTALMPYCILI